MTYSPDITSKPDSFGPEREAEELIGRLIAAGVDLSVEENDVIFEGPPHALGQETITALRENKSAVVSIFERNRTRGVLMLGAASWEQHRMEWRNRADRNPATYNVCLRVELLGDVDPHLLGRTATALVGRHEILRTRFAWYGRHLLQEIMGPPRSVLQVLETTALGNASDQEVSDWCERRGAAAFDLGAEAPARFCYAPVGPRRAVLLITFHHIACDGWSIDRFFREFETLCRAETRGDVSVLTPVPITPRDFAQWEMSWLTDDRISAARSLWADELQGAVLAPKLKRSSGEPAKGADACCVVRKFEPTVAAAVTAAANALSIGEFSLYFAAFAMLLIQETDGRDCAVVIAVANRTRPQHEELMGLTRNAQPIRCSVQQGDTIEDVARRISARVERALACQWYPISLMASPDDNQEDVDFRRLPITFGLARPSEVTMGLPGFSATLHNVYLGAARAEFSLLVRHQDDVAEAFFEYSKAQFSAEDAGLIADRFISIVQAEVERVAGQTSAIWRAEGNAII